VGENTTLGFLRHEEIYRDEKKPYYEQNEKAGMLTHRPLSSQ